MGPRETTPLLKGTLRHFPFPKDPVEPHGEAEATRSTEGTRLIGAAVADDEHTRRVTNARYKYQFQFFTCRTL